MSKFSSAVLASVEGHVISVSNWVAPGHLPRADERWLLSLFFSAGEVPFLAAQAGVTRPLMHYWLPAYEPELNAC